MSKKQKKETDVLLKIMNVMGAKIYLMLLFSPMSYQELRNALGNNRHLTKYLTLFEKYNFIEYDVKTTLEVEKNKKRSDFLTPAREKAIKEGKVKTRYFRATLAPFFAYLNLRDQYMITAYKKTKKELAHNKYSPLTLNEANILNEWWANAPKGPHGFVCSSLYNTFSFSDSLKEPLNPFEGLISYFSKLQQYEDGLKKVKQMTREDINEAGMRDVNEAALYMLVARLQLLKERPIVMFFNGLVPPKESTQSTSTTSS